METCTLNTFSDDFLTIAKLIKPAEGVTEDSTMGKRH